MTTYSQPGIGDGVLGTLEAVMRKWHQHLHEAEVRVGVLMAGNPDTAPLKRNGAPLLARIRVVPLMWRVLTGVDALLEIDEQQWADLEDDSRVALIDHELAHIETVEEDNGFGGVRLNRDDIGRPKLTTVDGDWHSSDGFLVVVKRHGEAAIEAINARRAHGLVTAAIQESLNETPEESETE